MYLHISTNVILKCSVVSFQFQKKFSRSSKNFSRRRHHHHHHHHQSVYHILWLTNCLHWVASIRIFFSDCEVIYMRKLRRGCPVRCIKHVCHVLDSFGMSYFTAHGQSQRTTCGVVWSVVNTGVRVNQVKPSNCFRRLEKLALPPIFGTRLPSLMTWNLRSYRTTVLTVQECDIFTF